ncbi:MAG TPA: hypothetical protein VGL37_02490 [Solirubrobacteraceae bacterium]
MAPIAHHTSRHVPFLGFTPRRRISQTLVPSPPRRACTAHHIERAAALFSLTYAQLPR